MTPEQRQKHLRTLEKIENMPRPQNWREVQRLMMELHPDLVQKNHDFAEACKETRQAGSNSVGAGKGFSLRHTMKIPDWLLDAIRKVDPGIEEEMSGRNHGLQILIGKQLYKAFPEYRIARNF